MTKDDTANRPRNITHRVSGKRQNGAHQRIERGEKYVVENQRRHDVVDGEVIPFQRGANRTGRCQLAGVWRMGGSLGSGGFRD
ncbi:hypothetical protein D3C75_1086910 [compost metagenome]